MLFLSASSLPLLVLLPLVLPPWELLLRPSILPFFPLTAVMVLDFVTRVACSLPSDFATTLDKTGSSKPSSRADDAADKNKSSAASREATLLCNIAMVIDTVLWSRSYSWRLTHLVHIFDEAQQPCEYQRQFCCQHVVFLNYCVTPHIFELIIMRDDEVRGFLQTVRPHINSDHFLVTISTHLKCRTASKTFKTKMTQYNFTSVRQQRTTFITIFFFEYTSSSILMVPASLIIILHHQPQHEYEIPFPMSLLYSRWPHPQK